MIPPHAAFRPPPTVTGFEGVVAGALRGLSLQCHAPITFLVDGDATELGNGAGATALRVLAGITLASSGRVVAFGKDPSRDPEMRRQIALLGDDVLLDPGVPLEESARAIAQVRGVSFDVVRAAIPKGRRAVADALAAPDRARLLLVRYPERYDASERDALTRTIGMAMERGAQAILATRAIDDWLHLAPHADALAALIVNGRVAIAGPAHELPWAIPLDGVSTRVIRVVLDPPIAAPRESNPPRTTPSARLAADLLGDAAIGPHLASVEPIGPLDLRIHTREPRLVARALAARAHAGVAIRSMRVQGATTPALAAAYGGRAW